ncbi:MAG: hypothetical protein ACXVZ4_07395 [Gaiellaceae bacterium]
MRIALTTAAATLALLVLGAAPASAAKPCWYQVQNDWYRHGGQIRRSYPVHCYVEAIQKLPEDSKLYSSAPDDIRRAMLLAIRVERGGGPSGPSPGVSASGPTGGGTSGAGGGGFLGSVFDTFAPKNANGVPVPLIVLGAIALLLLLAGGGSVLARRVQSRKIAIAPPEPPAGNGS